MQRSCGQVRLSTKNLFNPFSRLTTYDSYDSVLHRAEIVRGWNTRSWLMMQQLIINRILFMLQPERLDKMTITYK